MAYESKFKRADIDELFEAILLLKDEEDSYRRRLIEALADLDEEEWELLEKISEKAAHKKKDQAPRA